MIISTICGLTQRQPQHSEARMRHGANVKTHLHVEMSWIGRLVDSTGHFKNLPYQAFLVYKAHRRKVIMSICYCFSNQM